MPGETLLPNQTAPDAMLHEAIARAGAALARRQHADGHWLFELEADATIPAEYVLLEHFLDRIDPALEAKIGVYLRSIQGAHGGWPLFHDGAFNLSASVKAYFALKAIGDDPDAPHMARARQAILAAGGAERTNVFTRAQLALFGQVPWRAVPVMPLEIMHLPLWFPFHLSKVSYWSRTVIVPLLVLMALRPVARNPRDVAIPELFRTPPAQVRDWIRGPYRSVWGRFFKAIDSVLRVVQPAFPRRSRQQRDREGGALRHRTAERRRRAGRHLSGDRQQRDDVRHAGLSTRASGCRDRLARGAQAAGGGGRSRLLPAVPVAGLGHRPRGPRDGGGRRRHRTPRVPGCASGRSSTWSATGRCGGPDCDRAAGRSSTPIRTIRMSTTPRWSACCCIATAILHTPRRSSGRANGSSACSHPTAAGARSSRRTRISI